jgi:predicted RNase H-like nuclease (RuvC/YqgF family)
MRFGPSLPWQPWENDHGKSFTGGIGEAAGAALYVASNIYSWSEAKRMPDRQAEANKKVLALQKEQYDALSKQQRDILNAAINTYMSEVNSLLSGTDFEDAFPDVPEAAEYVPVDTCCVQGSTIECNISHTQRADDYVRYINRLHEQNDLTHALAGDPRFLVTLDIQSKSINDLSRGLLPVGDVVEVLGDNAEQASLVGRIGNTRKTTARDLGISKLRAMAAGRKEFREATTWFNTSVSSIQRQMSIQTMMLAPQERITLALHQSQLIQQSLQNKNNALAQKSPHLMAELQTKLQQIITKLQAKSSEALLVNTHLPNPALMVPAPSMSNVSGLVGGIGQAIKAAQQSHFFNDKNVTQEGYVSDYSGSSGFSPSGYKASDRPPGY